MRRRYLALPAVVLALGVALCSPGASAQSLPDSSTTGSNTVPAISQASSRAAGFEVQLLGLLPALSGGLPEAELPFAKTTLQPYGSSALASPLYPGAVAGDPGSAIGLASGPIVAQLGPLASSAGPVVESLGSALKYPVQARAAYPASPSDPARTQLGIDPAGGIVAGGTMLAAADETGAAASAAFGESVVGKGVTLPGLPLVGADSASLVSASGVSASSTARLADGVLRSVAKSAISELDILGGLIHIEGLRSEASAQSDSAKGTGRTGFKMARATINRTEVTIDEKGVNLAGTRGGDLKAVQSALANAGVADVRLLSGSVRPVTDRPWATTAVSDVLEVRMKVAVPLLPDLLPTVLGLVPTGALPISLPVPLGLPRELEVLLRVGGTESAADLFAPPGDELAAIDTGSFDIGSFDTGSFDTGSFGAPAGSVSGAGGNEAPLSGVVPLSAAFSRWGLGGGALLAVVAILALFSLFLAYARWQLLQKLPGKAGFKQ